MGAFTILGSVVFALAFTAAVMLALGGDSPKNYWWATACYIVAAIALLAALLAL